jgi:MFS family permease
MRWLEMLVAGIFTFELTGSALMVALVTVARTLPQLMIGALVGVIGDALNRKHLLLAGLFVVAATAAVLSALAISGAIEVWHVALGAIIAGTLASSEMAVRRRMIADVVPAPAVGRAIALDSLSNSFARMLGPLVGGIMFEALGLGGAYLVSALLHLAAAVGMSRLEYQQERRVLNLVRIPAELAEGLAVVRRQPILLAVVLVSIITNVFGFSYSALIPPLGLEKFGVSPALVGLLAAAEPLGAVLGGIAVSTGWFGDDRPRQFIGGSFGFLIAVIVMAFAPWFILAYLAVLLGGIGTARYGILQTSLAIADAPPAVRSRVMGMVTMSIGTGPFGVLAAGVLSEAFGPATALVTMAVLGLAALAAVRWRIPELRL